MLARFQERISEPSKIILFFESLVDVAPFSDSKNGVPYTNCKACKVNDHPWKKITLQRLQVCSSLYWSNVNPSGDAGFRRYCTDSEGLTFYPWRGPEWVMVRGVWGRVRVWAPVIVAGRRLNLERTFLLCATWTIVSVSRNSESCESYQSIAYNNLLNLEYSA